MRAATVRPSASGRKRWQKCLRLAHPLSPEAGRPPQDMAGVKRLADKIHDGFRFRYLDSASFASRECSSSSSCQSKRSPNLPELEREGDKRFLIPSRRAFALPALVLLVTCEAVDRTQLCSFLQPATESRTLGGSNLSRRFRAGRLKSFSVGALVTTPARELQLKYIRLSFPFSQRIHDQGVKAAKQHTRQIR
jgi:hypothetical protein